MVYAEFKKEENKSNYFDNKEKNNLNSWKKIEEKRINNLNIFLKDCYSNNNEIKQNITINQHYLINNK
jgi:hypothetical protein